MPKRARIHFVSLRSSLVNLPISIYGPLVERSIRPQHLAVHLTLVPGVENNQSRIDAYFGWTGMASASSLAHLNAGQSGERSFETLEMDPQYAQGLGLAQGDLVEIGLLHDLPQAKMVITEPLSADDWEIIEIHAAHVESTLLSQVRVAKVGQEIDIWVLGRTRVRLRVTGLDPPSKKNALLLSTNTEVSIAPKLHSNKQISSPKRSLANGHAPTVGVSTESTIPPNDRSCIFRVLPARLLPAIRFPDYSESDSLAFVSHVTFTQLHASKFTSADSFYCGQFRPLRSPADPTAPPPPRPNPDPMLARLASSGSHASSGGSYASSKSGKVWIGVSEGLPAGHIVFSVLPEGVDEWALVRMSLSLNPEVIKMQDSIVETGKSSTYTRATALLAGVDDILTRCTKFCLREFLLHSMTNSIHGFSGLLVTGRSGSGKTSIVRAVASSLQEDPRTFAYIHYIDVSKFSEQSIPSIKAQFNYWFDKCAWHRPSILILDDLDKLLSAEVEHANSFRSRHLTEIFLTLFSSGARTASVNSRAIVLLATAESTASLHSLINSFHIFKEVIHVTTPNKEGRRDILARIVQDRLDSAKDLRQDQESPINFSALSTQTEGYSATDLKDLVARAIHQVAMRASNPGVKSVLMQSDFVTAQVDFVPLSLRDIKLEKSDVAWSDIGGLSETRRILQETLEWPTKYGPIFKQSPLRLRSGLLLYGFPGCGKTLLASAVAKECGLNFISVKGPEILNKYIGASEKSVRDLFERASAAKPCILFFDEFDSIAPKRGHDSTGVTDRVVNQMLTQMDGAEGLEGVYVLAATSRPDLIDSALLRPGRLDKSLFCNMPDASERKEILMAIAKKMPVAPLVDFDQLAAKTEGFSGADLQALLYNAHLDVIHLSIGQTPLITSISNQVDDKPIEYITFGNAPNQPALSKAEEAALQRRLRQIQSSSSIIQSSEKQIIKSQQKNEIQQEHVLRALRSMQPSVSPQERMRLGKIYREFVSSRSGSLPVPPDASGVGNRVTLG
ncbi:AAA-domain-containing protein [Phlegmacium glaucopus]|nr:AAA-domain-containing protein [Phlegmacium glaucopus]